jgi:aminoglycoside phosphotransferase family enzyme
MREPDIRDKVACLRSLQGGADEVIETHFAFVVLAGEKAYKIRKPVQRETMDYTTLEARHHDCREEIRLNGRLAPGIYLRAVPLKIDGHGTLALGGDGRTVDWVVEMRRLDRDAMLDAVLRRGPLSSDRLEPLIAMLAEFYRDNALPDRSRTSLARRLLRQVEVNGQLFQQAGMHGADELAVLQRRFLQQNDDLLAARVGAGCVAEGHGDLRPEHVHLGDPVAIIDCLEFDRDLRMLDRAEELSFLALECDRLGAGSTGETIRGGCLAELRDEAPRALLDFYFGHRAAMRARLYIWRTHEPDDGHPEQWLRNAADYLDRALVATRRCVA